MRMALVAMLATAAALAAPVNYWSVTRLSGDRIAYVGGATVMVAAQPVLTALGGEVTSTTGGTVTVHTLRAPNGQTAQVTVGIRRAETPAGQVDLPAAPATGAQGLYVPAALLSGHLGIAVRSAPEERALYFTAGDRRAMTATDPATLPPPAGAGVPTLAAWQQMLNDRELRLLLSGLRATEVASILSWVTQHNQYQPVSEAGADLWASEIALRRRNIRQIVSGIRGHYAFTYHDGQPKPLEAQTLAELRGNLRQPAGGVWVEPYTRPDGTRVRGFWRLPEEAAPEPAAE